MSSRLLSNYPFESFAGVETGDAVGRYFFFAATEEHFLFLALVNIEGTKARKDYFFSLNKGALNFNKKSLYCFCCRFFGQVRFP